MGIVEPWLRSRATYDLARMLAHEEVSDKKMQEAAEVFMREQNAYTELLDTYWQ